MKDNQLIFGGKLFAPTTITFMLNDIEEIKLSKEGFFYRSKLVEEDHEIYLRFKEWMDNTYLEKSKTKLLDNLISLMNEALKFYANKENYNSISTGGKNATVAPIVSDEYGSQARFAIGKIKEITEANDKMETEYIKDIVDGIKDDDSPENIMNIIETFKNIEDD